MCLSEKARRCFILGSALPRDGRRLRYASANIATPLRWLLARRPDDAWQEAICNYSFKWAWSWHNFFIPLHLQAAMWAFTRHVYMYPISLATAVLRTPSPLYFACLAVTTSRWSKKITAHDFLQTSQLAGDAWVQYTAALSSDLTVYPTPPTPPNPRRS